MLSLAGVMVPKQFDLNFQSFYTLRSFRILGVHFDPENWKNLKTNPKKVTHLRSKMRDLVKKFAGDDINSLLFLHFPKIKLEDPAMERLKNLCNELDKQVKAKNASREINHIYTNIISCIVQFKNEIGKRVEYQDVVKAG